MFIVLEIKASEEVSTLVYSFENRNEAEHKYHDILTNASISNVPKHGATMLSDDGRYIKNECFIHGEEVIQDEQVFANNY